VDFPEDDPKLIARLILFLYMDHFPAWNHTSDNQEGSAWTYPNRQREGCPVLTTKWMDSLRSLLHLSDNVFINGSDAEIYEQDYGESLATVVSVHALAVKMDVPKLATAAQQEYLKAKTGLPHSNCVDRREDDFLTSIKIVYQTTLDTDRSLRDIALFAVQRRLAKLRECISKDLEDDEDTKFRETLSSTPEFAVELLTFNQHGKAVQCNKCKRMSAAILYCACGMRGLCGYGDCVNKAYWTDFKCILCGGAGIHASAKLGPPLFEDSLQDCATM
jgi:hypothetical protein